ncbi:hypothetical protein B0T16DRAFT_86170 [Cercophora newfieldiana]|uniref:Uncharacterized protein n=1 Tax=Cercophora newfieldiana TaxID=92897 RepID=A0AA40CWH7_9PEZI|nr:hypothetical protein B0T16DRAFT_86170 [Cercophora newfieldiana]
MGPISFFFLFWRYYRLYCLFFVFFFFSTGLRWHDTLFHFLSFLLLGLPLLKRSGKPLREKRKGSIPIFRRTIFPSSDGFSATIICLLCLDGSVLIGARRRRLGFPLDLDVLRGIIGVTIPRS